eukprot:Unigene3057_Nuclearia_a/m.9402 Unigene3057_Nuclearia_a/g.9402  ORF Unigene3057_Nuclearia_a/g.9402 Unigene3057_Nuclearia_a/m.9402 type:complete len:325 (-) Unigene3057_Nuclearia_a:60-1034(-)
MPSTEWVAVGSALLRAEEAVRADAEGNYKQALVCYKDAILLLDEQVLEAVPEEQRDKLIEAITSYTNRVDIIITNIPELGRNMPPPSLSAFTFKEQPPIGTMPETAPSDPLRRPYWLMKLLALTMTRGGYMTPKLYVPRNVWFQQGAKFTAIESKFTNCETILIWLQKLQDETLTDTNKVSKDLDEFIAQLENVQNALARKLKFISELKQEKNVAVQNMSARLAQMGSKISKSVERLQANVMRLKIDDDTAYIELLIQVFELSQFFNNWINHFEAAQEAIIVNKLKRVSDFFYNVLCAFVLRDFSMLLERYMKKTRQSFLTPTE